MADRIKNYQQEAEQITILKDIRTDLSVTPSSYTPDTSTATRDRVVTFAQAEEELVVLGDIEKGVKQQVVKGDIADKRICNIEKLLQGNLYDYQTDSTSGYTKTVPGGAMPYAGLEQIGGKTVVWNQLVDSGTTTVNTISGHKYYTLIDGTASIVTSDGSAISIVDDTADMVCDLTLMFGSGNEPSTVEEFQQMFPADYYEYNEGELLSAGVTSVKSVGKNLYNPSETASDFTNTVSNADGSFTATLNNSTSSSIYGRNYRNLPTTIKENSTITIVTEVLALTGSVKNIVHAADGILSSAITISNPSVGVYVNKPTTATQISTNYLPSYVTQNANTNGTIQYRISIYDGDVTIDTSDFTYAPYMTETYPIPASIKALEGYGWSAGTAYNYIDYERKKFVKNVAKVGLGTLSWQYYGEYVGHHLFYSDTLNNLISYTDNNKIYTLCNKYTSIANANGNYMNDLEMRVRYNDGRLYVNDDAYTDAESFKASLTNVEMVYELVTPQEIDISAYLTDDNLISVESGGTLTFPNSNGTDYQIPVPSAETYMIDLQSALGE